MKQTRHETRPTAAELRAWLGQFPADTPVFVGGTPVSGYIFASAGDEKRKFALYDEKEDGYLGVAVSIKGTIFTHPCDSSAEAAAADRAAKARGDYPYTHLYEGDDALEAVEDMLEGEEEQCR